MLTWETLCSRERDQSDSDKAVFLRIKSVLWSPLQRRHGGVAYWWPRRLGARHCQIACLALMPRGGAARDAVMEAKCAFHGTALPKNRLSNVRSRVPGSFCCWCRVPISTMSSWTKSEWRFAPSLNVYDRYLKALVFFLFPCFLFSLSSLFFPLFIYFLFSRADFWSVRLRSEM